ncbi:aromatic amino acid transaminase [Bradyrhizobium sp. SZCCHNR2035]|uniref:amino acid aminotransferase n=1 Tax=Bradyrhizobium sp. SZCCHNR2035 TaxID=3057386 RepID=UPI00291691DB|nr:aromatic amino acid transaminase [Bradyrhizobium sp. SZCCHNR2035]
MKSLLGRVEPYAGDPILLLNEVYERDPRVDKANLGIGVYLGEDGAIPVLQSVRLASERIGIQVRGYLPMEGHPRYRDLVCELVLGKGHPAVLAGRVTTIQTVGSTGGISLAADLLAKQCPGRQVYVSDPSWDNHHGLFQRAGFRTSTYPYWNPKTRSLDFDGLIRALREARDSSIIVVQPVCHNPTGIDLNADQESVLSDLLLEKRHLVVFDMAYQGFGAGLDEDAGFVRRFAERAVDGGCLIVNSFSKNLALYGERCGALTVVCCDKREAECVLGQLKLAIRNCYATPPMTGALLVSVILAEAKLFTCWSDELSGMRERMHRMRQRLATEIRALADAVDTKFLLEQRGMFSFAGLSPRQISQLRREGVYLLDTGRMCIAGLTSSNVAKVARCFCAVTKVECRK